MVGVARLGRFLAAGEHAPAVPLVKSGTDGGGDEPFGPSDVEDLGRASHGHRQDVSVTQELSQGAGVEGLVLGQECAGHRVVEFGHADQLLVINRDDDAWPVSTMTGRHGLLLVSVHHGEESVCAPHAGCESGLIRVQAVEAAVELGCVGVDDTAEGLCVSDGQAAADQDGSVVVVDEGEVSGAEGAGVFSLESDRLALVGADGVDDFDEVAGETAELGGIVLVGEPDHQRFGAVGLVVVEVVGKEFQDAGDGVCLGGQNRSL